MPNQQTRQAAGIRSGNAIIIGGSIAGLLAARVLADHFERVTLLERDLLPADIQARKGVPQGRHVHALLARGLEIMSTLFPGLESELIAGGAVPVDLAGETRWYHFGGYRLQFESGFVSLMMSRPLLEWHIRRRVLALPNVVILQECAVNQLLASADGARVTGVALWRRSSTADVEQLSADLIIDASGRGSQSPAWLSALGYEKPAETVIKIGVGYTTRIYQRRPSDLVGARAILIAPKPPQQTRVGALSPIEGDRWMVTLGGWLGDHAPTDEQGFLEFARSLPAPDIYAVISSAEPLSDPVAYKFPSNLRRHYERLDRFPAGYLILGDAMCSFNPVYGQGMTVSALQATALDISLRERSGEVHDLARRFYKRAATLIDTPWMAAAGEDFRYPQVEGVRPPGVKLLLWYGAKLQFATQRDAEVYRAFLYVMNLMRPPTSLFHPRIIRRVLWNNLSHAAGKLKAEQPQEQTTNTTTACRSSDKESGT
jgi:2-polyprenyl-6-methoxyphenol hydroxylase-like FAD-dependent oxidoreductase